MNDNVIAIFNGSKILHLSALDEAKLYLDALKKLYPEARIVE